MKTLKTLRQFTCALCLLIASVTLAHGQSSDQASTKVARYFGSAVEIIKQANEQRQLSTRKQVELRNQMDQIKSQQQSLAPDSRAWGVLQEKYQALESEALLTRHNSVKAQMRLHEQAKSYFDQALNSDLNTGETETMLREEVEEVRAEMQDTKAKMKKLAVAIEYGSPSATYLQELSAALQTANRTKQVQGRFIEQTEGNLDAVAERTSDTIFARIRSARSVLERRATELRYEEKYLKQIAHILTGDIDVREATLRLRQVIVELNQLVRQSEDISSTIAELYDSAVSGTPDWGPSLPSMEGIYRASDSPMSWTKTDVSTSDLVDQEIEQE